MRKTYFLLISLVTFFLASSTWAADISGTWVLKYTGHSGDDRVLDMVIKAAGGDFTVTATHPSLGEMAGTGTLSGNDIAMTLAASGDMKVSFEMTGTVAGNKMSGTKEVVMSQEGGQGRPQEGEGGASSKSGNSSRGERGTPQGDASGKSRGDAPGGAPQGDAPSGAPGNAPEGGASQDKEVSNTWTAEKK